ncbi:PREDICTED: uncharacterized protein LOC105313449 [Amphimedon queenslandica]|uniref:Lysine-specific metallo-endopeptidase domain-containing protein n=1 Tax=Amphimedon queenslandica TaxID=400682 RepID=A0A1X7UH42_AMPQE|nr:PREDICTED: uncharacterized protein LOC105313449 [Amphimedon queenslandica]|eukprot:XP_011405191.2 PREDICTED: uncharacterized protein LOC105313449 [Amphimedon queenslandica]
MKALLFSLCLVTCLVCALSAPNKQPVSVKMDCRRGSSAVACSFLYTNNAREDLYLLTSETPIEGLLAPFLDVSLHGSEPIPYEGIIAYRLPPTKEDFLLLKAGESFIATVQITDAFNIDTDGLYTIRYSKPLLYLTVDDMELQSMDELKELAVDETVYVVLEDTHLLVKPKELEEPEIESIVHIEDCASVTFLGGDRKNDHTLRAHKRICSQIGEAKGRVGSTDALYKEWFGVYTDDRGTQVTSVYDRVENVITDSSQTVKYYNNGPNCKSGVGAYTYIKKPLPYLTVFLCDAYFKLTQNCKGVSPTKERVLMHEWAHALGWAKDIKYHARKCRTLAKNHPNKAVNNADSYSFHYCGSY